MRTIAINNERDNATGHNYDAYNVGILNYTDSDFPWGEEDIPFYTINQEENDHYDMPARIKESAGFLMI